MQQLIKLIGVCMVFALIGCSHGRKWTKPTVSAARPDSDVDFRIRDLLVSKSLKPVVRIDVWSFTEASKLWELETVDWSEAPLAESKLVYGKVPSRMRQAFPSSNEPPRRIDQGEAIIVRITYIDDQFLTPGSGADTKLFRKTLKGFVTLPRHSNVAQRIHGISAQDEYRKSVSTERDKSKPE